MQEIFNPIKRSFLTSLLEIIKSKKIPISGINEIVIIGFIELIKKLKNIKRFSNKFIIDLSLDWFEQSTLRLSSYNRKLRIVLNN